MPYTPNATVVTEPADTGVAASTAAAEFRTLKLYLRDVILAGLALKRDTSNNIFTGSISALSGVVSSTTVQAANGVNVTASGGFQATGYAGIGLQLGALMSLGWSSAITATQPTSLTTAVTCNGHTGTITTAAGGASDTYYVFTVNNSSVKAEDLVVAACVGGANASQFIATAHDVQAGSFKVRLYCPPGAGGSGLTSKIGFAVLTRNL